jgi:6-phosphofructokinase
MWVSESVIVAHRQKGIDMGKKGNLVVGQSGGPTAVINSSLVGVIHEAMQHDAIGAIYGMVHGVSGVLHEEFIDLRQESAETLERLRYTPASALGTVRYKLHSADYDRLLDVLMAYDVRYFLYIGGNDSMDTAHKVHLAAQAKGYELYALGVPKTVDNDLAYTDHCPGYGSAARFVATAVRDTGYDTEAMGESSPVKFIEVMGRNAGWLTAAAALARVEPNDPPQLLYVPECGVSLEQVVNDVRYWYETIGHCVVAVSEGMRNEQGEEIGSGFGQVELDAFGHARKGGVVETLEAIVKAELGVRVRHDKPGYLQRSCAALASPVDRAEAYLVGQAAVREALAGVSDRMITLERQPGPTYAVTTGLAPLAEVANAEHLLPREYINAAGNGVTEAFLEYARPLIGEPLAPYARLAKHAVPKRLAE